MRSPLSLAGIPWTESATGPTILTLLREPGGSPIVVPRIGGLRELLVDGLKPWVTVGEDTGADDDDGGTVESDRAAVPPRAPGVTETGDLEETRA